MLNKKNILIVAGEESGDIHAAQLLRRLQQDYGEVHCVGIGGRHLQNAGMQLLVNLAQYGVTGISEVVRHLRIIRQAFQSIKNHLQSHAIDVVILVDYPGFNLRLARYLKKHYAIPTIFYIGPQLWAWKENRMEIIKKTVDHMAVILPFEKAMYKKAAVPVSYVGHPLANQLQITDSQAQLRKNLHLPVDKKVISLLPGSRRNEIQRLMPILVDTMEQLLQTHPDLHFAIPIAGSVSASQISQYLPPRSLPLHFFNQQAQTVVAASDCVIVASGTASLECALLGIPGCIIYKASTVTAVIARRLIKTPYLGLANIISQKCIMPELLQQDCNASAIYNLINQLLISPQHYSKMQSDLSELRSLLLTEAADCSIEQLVASFLQ